MQWVDQRLSWAPADYGDLDVAYFDEEEVWTPDVQPWNVYKEVKDGVDKALAKASPSGHVYWSRPRQFD
eukprot:5555920-Prymnesium_polylepis.1